MVSLSLKAPRPGWTPGGGARTSAGYPTRRPLTSSMEHPAGEGKPMNVLPMERRVAVVSMLTDCGSVRATSRQTGVHKTTILSLILKLGEGCRSVHNRLVRGLHAGRVEADEMHAYV